MEIDWLFIGSAEEWSVDFRKHADDGSFIGNHPENRCRDTRKSGPFALADARLGLIWGGLVLALIDFSFGL